MDRCCVVYLAGKFRILLTDDSANAEQRESESFRADGTAHLKNVAYHATSFDRGCIIIEKQDKAKLYQTEQEIDYAAFIYQK